MKAPILFAPVHMKPTTLIAALTRHLGIAQQTSFLRDDEQNRAYFSSQITHLLADLNRLPSSDPGWLLLVSQAQALKLQPSSLSLQNLRTRLIEDLRVAVETLKEAL